MAQVLIIEDELLLAKSLSRTLVDRGHDCVTASSAEEGLNVLSGTPVDIVMLDLQLPGMSGLEALKSIKQLDPDLPVIIATGYATMASAVDAMRSGACDFLRKPLDTEEVYLAIERALSNASLQRRVSYYANVEAIRTDEDKLIYESPRMKMIVADLQKMLSIELDTSSDYPPVLILGETGVGKDLVARILHFGLVFADRPFIEVNCTTLPKGLEEAELFGYEKGSFTGADTSKHGLFELASGGTIFLNEIGDLTAEAQMKMLQVIERKSLRRVGGLRDIEIDVRIIAATNRDLSDEERFRKDLYFRLNNLVISLPPLRERKEDIPALAQLFIDRYGRKYGVNSTLSDDAKAALIDYPWPGNVRELRQLIERVIFLSRRELITKRDLSLPETASAVVHVGAGTAVSVDSRDLFVNLEDVERQLLLLALKASAGNVSEAARRLGIGREALRYRIKKYGIHAEIKIVG